MQHACGCAKQQHMHKLFVSVLLCSVHSPFDICWVLAPLRDGLRGGARGGAAGGRGAARRDERRRGSASGGAVGRARRRTSGQEAAAEKKCDGEETEQRKKEPGIFKYIIFGG